MRILPDKLKSLLKVGIILLVAAGIAFARPVMGEGLWLSPCALTVSTNGNTAYVACAMANRVLCLDTASLKFLDAFSTPQPPSGLVLSLDGTHLFVICAAPESKVCIIDLARRKIIQTIPVGHTAQAPVISPDGKSLFVCNQFDNDVSVIDLASKREVRRIAVQREPVASDITKDGKYLLVANHLHNGRADVEDVAAVVSVIDVAAGKVVKELRLPSGSEILKDIRVSPDGKYAAVTHIFASFGRATTQVRLGWMNANALTILDLTEMKVRYTLLLDEPTRGAAKASFLEGTTNYDDAFEWYAKLEERYNHSGPLIAFCERYKNLTGDNRFEPELKKRMKTLFPGGIEKVSLADFHGVPADGVLIQQQNALLTAAGLRAGDVIVALNGTRTHAFTQYMYIRDSLTGPEMDLIVWQGNRYHEFKASPPNHLFGVDFGDYRAQ